MSESTVPKKIEAIYELREAVEAKVLAEVDLAREKTPEAQAAYLDAALTLESKTQDAIEICHECGEAHGGDAHRERVEGSHDNVIDVDFRPRPGDPG